MARERTIHTRADGSKFYLLTGKKGEDIEGVGSLTKTASMEVNLINTEGEEDDILERMVNAVGGDNPLSTIAALVNDGMIAKGRTDLYAKLNKAMGANAVVSNFAQIVKAMSGFSKYAGTSKGEVAQDVLKNFPDLRNDLADAGMEFTVGEDELDESAGVQEI